jgi:hypothetical protein
MPHLPARELAQSRLARIIRRATRDQKRRLTDAMGWPPDVDRIPPTLWLEIEREQAAATSPTLAMIFLTAGAVLSAILDRASRTRIDPAEVAQEALRYGQQRSLSLANGMAEVTRARLRDAATEVREAPQGKAEADIRRDFKDRVNRIFSPERAQSVGVTDTGFAARGGGNLIIRRFEADNPGKSVLKIWRHPTRIVRGSSPCPLCAPLVGTSQDEWQGINPAAAQGPPLHPACQCEIQTMLIDGDEAQRLPMTPPDGWDRPYRDQFQRIRDSRSPRDQ